LDTEHTHADRTHGGLWETYREANGYRLAELRLNRARVTHEPVGNCRVCGLHLYVRHYAKPGERDSDGQVPDGDDGSAVSWFEFYCVNGHESASPEGRRMEKSGQRRERPSGWDERRAKQLKDEQKQRTGEQS
jgi:hypothetical protein